jgi:MFS family permease
VGLAARWQWYPLVLVGLLLFGFGNTASQQSRFAAADVVSDARRGRAVSIVVWASTIGVVFGPKLWGPAGRFMTRFGLTELGGPFVVGGAVYVIAALASAAVIRPDPRAISRLLRDDPVGASNKVDVRACLRRPALQLAFASLIIGQVVMVAVMSVTSVHLKDHGYSADGIGTVISGHVLGMYAPSPVTGWLVDRIGRLPVVVGGSVIAVVACVMAAAAQPSNHALMIVALFILGVGWNGTFVAGSTLTTDAVTPAERPRIQAVADMATFLASGIASLLAGFALEWSSYATMGIIGACIGTLCALLAMAYRPRMRSAQPAT